MAYLGAQGASASARIEPRDAAPDGPPRRRVAIIGGGLSGLTAAYELSATEALRQRFEVTVHQVGWRLGGKLASGRNPAASMRNEEHGLHVWFGFYDNAFRMAREVLDAWDKPLGCPIQSLDDMLVPHSYTPVGISGPSGYRVWDVQFARNRAVAGEDPRDESPEVLFSRVTAMVLSNLRNFSGETGRAPGDDLGEVAKAPAGIVRSLLHAASTAVVERLVARAGAVRGCPGHRDVALTRRWVARVQRALPVLDKLATHRRELLNARHAVEFFAAFFMALTAPEYRILADFDLDRVNHLDFREWLQRHGASRSMLDQWPLVRVPYDATFQYVGGDLNRPAFEAGTAARFFVRAYFGYRGAAAYLIGAGMGEAFIAPLYEVLKKRGVRFSFFHRLASVELDTPGRHAERLVFRRQAQVRGTYAPLSTYRGLRCWSTQPDWDQLEDGVALRAANACFETDADLGTLETLVRGQDFDEVILALPAGVLRSDGATPSCVQAVVDASAPLKAFASAMNLVPSVAAQLWCDPSMQGLGWTRPRAAMVSWALPYSIWADMSDVLRVEGWEHPGPLSCHYLCGTHPLPEGGDAREIAVSALQGQLEEHGAHLWPGARNEDGGFDWSVLHDPLKRKGPARLQAQYIRANVEPADLCDGAAPSTSALRPEAHESGLQNVVFAGTWTRTNINSTCVEAATISGLAAARVLTGPVRSILSESFMQRPRPVVCRPASAHDSVAWRVG